MFKVNEDLSIYVTRGDSIVLSVSAEGHKYQDGDVVRFKVFEKKDCENVVLQKDYGPISEEEVEVILTGEDTKIGEYISKPKDYWYEIELNPDTDPKTIIGYDEKGPKVLKLFPEGGEMP